MKVVDIEITNLNELLEKAKKVDDLSQQLKRAISDLQCYIEKAEIKLVEDTEQEAN